MELYGFAFTALAIDETFTLHNFLPTMNEIVSIYFPIKTKEQMRPKICENLITTNFKSKFTGYKKSVVGIEMCADS